jgi:exopolyphosphatase/guanosine-5'-triphosphate,3'-diphosphate pyrophosphatase
MSEQPTAEDTPSTIAAVDLGSNSFHMVVARPVNGHLNILDRLREPVRLAYGLGPDGELDAAAQQRAMACLERFGQRLRDMPPGSVRAVGTNTLRTACNSDAFLEAAAVALGHPIEVIAGLEEARVIYLGVSHSLPASPGQRLVMDIGGGSTELIIGEGFEPIHMESLYMGCVSLSQEYFSDGSVSAKAMRRAEIAAGQELQAIEQDYRRLGWASAVGSSGTIRAVGDVVQAMGWSDGGITLAALQRLRAAMIEAGHVERLGNLQGLPAERAAIFPGGVAILIATFAALGIERMQVSDGALREGLLYDLMGRIRHEDVRSRTISVLKERYHVDKAQAQRVHDTAFYALHQVMHEWKLEDECAANLLEWAARLHEIGLAVAHSGYHKHGAYLLEFSDMPGFSRQEQKALSALVRSQRRKFSPAVFRVLPEAQRERLMCLSILLRLAVLLHRSRADIPLPPFHMEADGKSLSLRFPAGWLELHPLTQADLAQEAEVLREGKFKLTFE